MTAANSDCVFVPGSDQREGARGGYPGHWSGRFIWAASSSGQTTAGKPLYRMFRKTFRLDGQSGRAVLRVTAGDKFIAYCNGTYLGRGPCRSVTPQWSFYDSFDLTDHLQPGDNTIAVMVFWHGSPGCFCADQRPGLWGEADIHLAKGEIQRVFTGPSWKTRPAEGWDTSAPPVNGAQGLVVECYRGGVDPADWHARAFDDSGWEDSVVLSVRNCWELLDNASCWEYLEPRLTPPLAETVVKPCAIVQTGYTRHPQGLSDSVAVAERMAGSEYTPCELPGVNLASLLSGDVELYSGDAGDPYIVLDFGRPYNAVPAIELEGADGDVVESAYSNVLQNGRCLGAEGGSRFAARYVAADGRQSWHPWNVATAFRYVTVVFRTGGRRLSVRSCHCIAHTYPVKQTGFFECSDPTLTRLWNTAINTNLMHLQDTYIMDPVRERAYYILAGEIEQSHLCYYISCGDLAATETHFRLTARTQLPCGKIPLMLPNCEHRGFPRDPRPFTSATYATIPGYVVFYSQAVVRRQMWFPKPGFLETQYPVLLRAAEWLDRQTDSDGLLFNMPPINWLDWPLYHKWNEQGLSGAMLGYNAVYVQFLAELAWCAGRLGYQADEAKWRARRERTLSAVRRLFWNPERGLFADFYTDRGRADTYSELLNAFALLAGVPDPDQKARLVETLKQPAADMTPVSPLYMFYVAEAMCACGEDAYAFDYMSRRYAPVLGDSDFPTLPEGWGDAGYEQGMGFVSIHGGGGGVAFALSTRMLGVSPTEEGFRRFRFRPSIGRLDHASGAIPSPAGLISVSWRREGKNVTLSVTVPCGCQCEADAPSGYRCAELPVVLEPGEYRFTAVKV
ncbi:MAG: hypothetical protein GXY33_21245 [Phycisphaerae bacterium]|nr:hypothetical protein [Phycisphaerae bacterium]